MEDFRAKKSPRDLIIPAPYKDLIIPEFYSDPGLDPESE